MGDAEGGKAGYFDISERDEWEKKENTLAKRCERWAARVTLRETYQTFQDCPCRFYELHADESQQVPSGCGFLSFQDQIDHNRNAVDAAAHAASAATSDDEKTWYMSIITFFVFMCVFSCLWFFMYSQLGRQLRRRNNYSTGSDQTSAAETNETEWEAPPSGKHFVSVEQPSGDTDLAEIVVVVVVDKDALESSAKESAGIAATSTETGKSPPPPWVAPPPPPPSSAPPRPPTIENRPAHHGQCTRAAHAAEELEGEENDGGGDGGGGEGGGEGERR